MDRRTFLAAAGSGTAVALAGCLDATALFSGDPPGDHDVGMTIDSYRPDQLEVESGQTVVFRNTSSHAHTVTAFQDAYPEGAEYWASGGFDSEQEAYDAWYSSAQGGKLARGDTYEHTFEIPGTYSYYCVPHIEAEMVGEIIVKE